MCTIVHWEALDWSYAFFVLCKVSAMLYRDPVRGIVLLDHWVLVRRCSTHESHKSRIELLHRRSCRAPRYVLFQAVT